jgi:gliding motility-associated protein GldC
MVKSTITIDVELDDARVPQQIRWHATEGTSGMPQEAKAMMLAFWDSAEKSALRIDLWTQKMMVDEMADFYYQTIMTMADSFERATKNAELVGEMKDYARGFFKKFQEQQLKENKAG